MLITHEVRGFNELARGKGDRLRCRRVESTRAITAAPGRSGETRSMLETELPALLEHTADAAFAVTEAGEIRSWNASAERV